MAFGKKSAAILVLIMALWGVSMGTIHWVGGFAGWTTVTVGSPIDYKLWASTRNFHVGDVVVFRYNNRLSNVVRVTHQNFNSCNATSPIAVYSSGSDTINLTRPGHFYFICSLLPGHCLAGQKVQFEATQLPSSVPNSVVYSESNGEALAPSPETMELIPGSASYMIKSFNLWLFIGVLAFGTYNLVELRV